jgi:hypothetical protein
VDVLLGVGLGIELVRVRVLPTAALRHGWKGREHISLQSRVEIGMRSCLGRIDGLGFFQTTGVRLNGLSEVLRRFDVCFVPGCPANVRNVVCDDENGTRAFESTLERLDIIEVGLNDLYSFGCPGLCLGRSGISRDASDFPASFV